MDGKIHEKLGEVSIADEVIASIAGLAATETRGVYALGGNILHDQITFSRSKSLSKSVRVHVDGNAVSLKVALVLDGSVPIPVVSKDAAERVRNAVESMTGMEVEDIRITVAGVKA
ncbi:MAG: Asp23/Gls24 family envelope stress response protein [Lachnospiraceae bacterium]|nr:Asp23/Gls24 family envelope stress response protein [Lachnospiraceae bacterium]